MLAVFKISRAKDEHDNEIEISMGCTSGLVRFAAPQVQFDDYVLTNLSSHPASFQCEIRPRDEKAVELIESFEIDT
jgi:hypothetical protein